MKNNFICILFFFFLNSVMLAENIIIKSKNISLDKDKKVSIFRDNVQINTEDNKIIKSDYAEYDKQNGLIKLKNNITAIDHENNIIEANYAEYNEVEKIFKSVGKTKIITSEKYIVEGKNIILNNNEGIIKSNEQTIITDKDKNIIYLENFEYQSKNSIFKSVGYIKIEDSINNTYEFSQIYIDTKKKEILGTDIKTFIDNDDFKVNTDNKPRIFANTVSIKNENTSFGKSIFTMCDYRKNDKCPPWSILAKEMLHDKKKKTIYYKNAVVKVYDIPIFYIPKLSHPDPTVDRRSGFLPPSFSDTKNLGFSVAVPYFFAVDLDKNFTLTSRIFADNNPFFMGEYNQALKNANLFTDFGYSEGYRETSGKINPGKRHHFFTNFIKNFKGRNESENSLKVSVQNVSDNKYLKLYKINSNLVDYSKDTLENSINYSFQTDDTFIGLNASIYETLKENYNDRYEYILPEVTLDKRIYSSENFGGINLQSNFKFHNYDTNKQENFFINDLDWTSKDIFFDSGVETNLLGKIRNINYEAKNLDTYKEDPTNEAYGALGFLSKLSLQKKLSGVNHLLTPKFFARYAPGSMRKDESDTRLDTTNAFKIDRLNDLNNFETGFTGTLGLDYKIKNAGEKFNFSVAQIISKNENKKMSSSSSLDEKLSDLVGSFDFEKNNINLNYSFAIDQNYNDMNYNEIGLKTNLGPIDINFDYLLEKKHIGNQDYFTTKLDFNKSKNTLVSFETKRNLITNSSEFYNLSYEYLNDCLRAGLVYRREFYNDSELEPENSLMFKITLVPFGNINSPSLQQ